MPPFLIWVSFWDFGQNLRIIKKWKFLSRLGPVCTTIVGFCVKIRDPRLLITLGGNASGKKATYKDIEFGDNLQFLHFVHLWPFCAVLKP